MRVSIRNFCRGRALPYICAIATVMHAWILSLTHITSHRAAFGEPNAQHRTGLTPHQGSMDDGDSTPPYYLQRSIAAAAFGYGPSVQGSYFLNPSYRFPTTSKLLDEKDVFRGRLVSPSIQGHIGLVLFSSA